GGWRVGGGAQAPPPRVWPGGVPAGRRGAFVCTRRPADAEAPPAAPPPLRAAAPNGSSWAGRVGVHHAGDANLLPTVHVALQLVHLERLRDHRQLERTHPLAQPIGEDDVAGHEDDVLREARLVILHPAHEVEAVSVVQPDVHENAVELKLLEVLDRANDRAGGADGVTATAECGPNRSPQRALIIDEEDRRHSWRPPLKSLVMRDAREANARSTR